MLTVVCFKWFNPGFEKNRYYVYTSDHVRRLQSMLCRHLSIPHEVVCATDDPMGLDCRTVPVTPEMKAMGPYFPKLLAFHPDAARMFGERILMLDLDTVIVGSLDRLVDRGEPFVAWAGRPEMKARFNTSMVLMDGGAFPEVWTRFGSEAPAWLAANGYEIGDQDWVSAHVCGETWPRSGGGIESFTPMQGRLPESARIVFFNGRSSPDMPKCQAVPWVRKHWR